MKQKMLMAYACTALLALPAATAVAADAREQGYGRPLMTEQERNEYRERMRAATSAEEREQIRYEHHERVRKRAEARGIGHPAQPPAGGMGHGRGLGQGGMGKGGGRDN